MNANPSQIQIVWACCGRREIKNTINNSSTNHCERAWTIMPKGWHNGANIYSKTHQLSMQQIVAGKKEEIMTNHVFLKCKNMWMYCKGHQIASFCKVDAGTENSLKQKSPITPECILTSMTHLCKVHARKRHTNTLNNLLNWCPGRQEPL